MTNPAVDFEFWSC